MQNVGVDNHNPVKTSNKQARGNSSDFLEGMCDSRTKQLTHRPGKILSKKHVNFKKGKKFYLFFFVFTCKNLIHTIFFEVSISFSTNSQPLSNSCFLGNFQKSNPDPLGKFFELIPRGMYPVEID